MYAPGHQPRESLPNPFRESSQESSARDSYGMADVERGAPTRAADFLTPVPEGTDNQDVVRHAEIPSTKEKAEKREGSGDASDGGVAVHVLERSASQKPSLNADVDEGFDPDFVKRTMRRIDLRLIPLLALLSSISLLDRSSLSLAREAGMQEELHLDRGSSYSNLLMAYTIPHLVCELPSIIGLRRFGPPLWLGTSCMLWGVVQLAGGFVKTAPALAVIRALLGMLEATVYPGLAALIGCYHIRGQLAFKMAMMHVLGLLAHALGAVFCWALSKMDGLAGYRGWSWIFIMEGILTVLIAFVIMWALPQFPHNEKRMLNDEQRRFLLTRIDRDRADAEPDQFGQGRAAVGKVLTYLRQPNLWLFSFFFGAVVLASNVLSSFLPRLLRGTGLTSSQAQLAVIPLDFVAIPVGLVTALLADRRKHYASFLSFNLLLFIGGFLVFDLLGPKVAPPGTRVHQHLHDTPKNQGHRHFWIRYVAMCIAGAGAKSSTPLVLAWSQACIRNQTKRAWTAGLLAVGGSIGSLIGSYTFMEREAPRYPTGIGVAIGAQILVCILAFCLSLFNRRLNRLADQGKVIIEGHPGFRLAT